MPLLKALRDRRAFTLIEVLVSSALTLIVLGMLFMVLLGVMNAWEGGTSRLQTNSDARLALDLIARDLEAFVSRQTTSNQEWLVSKLISVTDAPSEIKSAWLTFLAPTLDRDAGQPGDIVALSYAVGFQDPLSTNSYVPMFGLYKAQASTTDTFKNALGLDDLTKFWEPRNPIDRIGFLCPNVVDFKITWWVRDLTAAFNTPLIPVPADVEVRLGNELNLGAQYQLEAADIRLTILTEEGARLTRLGTLTQERLEKIIEQHGRTHTQRVVLRR